MSYILVQGSGFRVQGTAQNTRGTQPHSCCCAYARYLAPHETRYTIRPRLSKAMPSGELLRFPPIVDSPTVFLRLRVLAMPADHLTLSRRADAPAQHAYGHTIHTRHTHTAHRHTYTDARIQCAHSPLRPVHECSSGIAFTKTLSAPC